MKTQDAMEARPDSRLERGEIDPASFEVINFESEGDLPDRLRQVARFHVVLKPFGVTLKFRFIAGPNGELDAAGGAFVIGFSAVIRNGAKFRGFDTGPVFRTLLCEIVGKKYATELREAIRLKSGAA